MIFFAGSLGMHGGSTFLIRIAQQFHAQGRKIAIVVLSGDVDDGVFSTLKDFAEIVMLKSLVHPLFAGFGTSQVSIFLPCDRKRVAALLSKYGSVVHVMGIFGLVLAHRWSSIDSALKITAGVYHQNEFLYESRGFFTREIRILFRSLRAENIIYFNEYNREKYSTFFNTDYANAKVLPIGITLPTLSHHRRVYIPGLFVSVGNLVGFKRYNEHIINIVAELAPVFPEIRYEIYGEGVNEPFLRALVQERGVEGFVTFKGKIPYAEFANVVERANAFIGSGTAVLEAAALGVPSIVGIESLSHASTYGFIQDVPGLSYNEIIPNRPLVSMLEIVQTLLQSPIETVEATGRASRKKSEEFSIERTVNGFVEVSTMSCNGGVHRGMGYWAALFAAFLRVAFLDRLGLDKTLRNRRNQSVDQ